MDAEHRHELKTNELADWLGHLPKFFKENSNTILGVVLICVALITWPMFNKMSEQKDLAEQTGMTQSIQLLEKDVYDVVSAPADDLLAQTEALNSMLVNADALLDKASETENPNLAALARIKAAQAIRTHLHLQKDVDAETLETQIGKAKDAYQKAFETADTATFKAMAQFGLGLCSEELGQTAQAAEIYQQIIDDESYAATVLPTQAQKRMDGLEENAEVFNFADVPVVVTDDIQSVSEMLSAPLSITSTESTPVPVPVAPAVEESAEATTVEEVTEAVTDVAEDAPAATE